MNHTHKFLSSLLAVTFVALAASRVALAAAHAHGVSHLTLASEVQVRGHIVTLADLLPQNTSISLLAAASKSIVALAPQPGSSRILSRNDILAAPLASPALLARLTIPPRIRISRAVRPLTREEILSAIRISLARSGFAAAAALSPSQIRSSAPILVTSENPALEVLRIDLASAPNIVRFALWTSREPQIHPFDVFLDAPAALSHWIASRTPNSVNRAAPALLVAAKSEILADAGSLPAPALLPSPLARRRSRKPQLPAWILPGRAARLTLLSSGLEVHTTAQPLQRGVRGQWIRVRNVATGEILEAKVVGPGSLLANF